MLAKGIPRLGRDAGLQEVEKLVASPLLHHSESLCKLLRYLAQKSVEQPGVPVKEYEIATEVFHRPPDFDPRLDSTVRVQTGRLRSKLTEYYAERPDDLVIVEIPKGSYSLTVHCRTPLEQDEHHDAVPTPVPRTIVPAAVETPRAAARAPFIPWLVALSVAIAAIVFLGFRQQRVSRPTAPIVSFWQHFFEGPDEPLIIYSNAVFVGRPETGLRYQQLTDGQNGIFDHYTGVGEVMGVHELDLLAVLFKKAFKVHRGRLISWDDARNSNIVFIGSPAENLSLREIPAPQQFVFRRVSEGPRQGDLGIENLHPRAGEKPFYFSSTGIPVSEDFGVIELMPGLSAPHQVLILAGITTFGTQAAVEYVCRSKKLEELLTQATGSVNGTVRPFEAVIRTQISGGVPIQTELVALHKR